MDQLEPRTVRRERLSEIVRRELVRLIRERGLRPGDSLPSEAQLAATLGVSKPIVREALHHLVALGVVDAQQGKNSTVQLPSSEPLEHFLRFLVEESDEGLREALELRRVFETGMAELAAVRASTEEIEALEEAIGKLERSVGDRSAWVEADLDFHMQIAKSAKNGLTQYLLEACIGLLRESIKQINRDHVSTTASLERHKRVFEAVRKGDPAGARKAMESHFDATDRARKVIADKAPWEHVRPARGGGAG